MEYTLVTTCNGKAEHVYSTPSREIASAMAQLLNKSAEKVSPGRKWTIA